MRESTADPDEGDGDAGEGDAGRDSVSLRLYKERFPPAEPVDEWNDRNRLYSLHALLNDSAGHVESASRGMYGLVLLLSLTGSGVQT